MFTLGKYAVGILLLQILISFNEFNGISCAKSEGESCENGGKPGVCEVIEKCPILEKDLKERKVLPENNWCGGFNAKKDVLYCCTELPVKLEVKSDPVNIPKKGSGGFVFPLNNTSVITQRSILSENADSSEHGNAIDTEFTSIKNPSTGIQQISSTESNNFDSVINNVFDNPVKSEALVAVTDYPIKNVATSTTTTTAQPLVLDAWMLEAIEQAKREAALLETTTTTTQAPTVRTTKSIVGYIDLSRKQISSTTTTTTTTAAPLIVSPNQFQNKPNNVQTVWVIEEPSGGQAPNNQQQVNWNRGRPNQNFNRPINQQQTNNWNRQQQQQQQQPQQPQQQQNWNRPSDPIHVIVIEEEPNGRDTNFQNNRQNWNRPVGGGGSNFNSQTGVNGNFNQQQQFRTHHHTWNGNGFNQGRPNAQNHNVEFVQAFNSNGNNQNRQINGQIGQIQVSSTVSSLNPDNPFLKTVLNPSQPQNQQRSGQLIQFQPTWNNNNNNNPSFGFRRF